MSADTTETEPAGTPYRRHGKRLTSDTQALPAGPGSLRPDPGPSTPHTVRRNIARRTTTQRGRASHATLATDTPRGHPTALPRDREGTRQPSQKTDGQNAERNTCKRTCRAPRERQRTPHNRNPAKGERTPVNRERTLYERCTRTPGERDRTSERKASSSELTELRRTTRGGLHMAYYRPRAGQIAHS